MLIKGSQLTDKQRREVLAAYVHRNTIEHPCNLTGGPTVPTQTDQDWLNDHAFYFVKDGSRLAANRAHCEPAFMADK
jgi:hypothetical protein